MGSCKSRQDRNNEITVQNHMRFLHQEAWDSVNYLASGSESAAERGFTELLKDS
jgi:hypothetical protein